MDGTMQRRVERGRWIVAGLYMVGTAYYSLVPRMTGPVGSAFAVLGDRVLHLGGYFVLSLLLAWSLKKGGIRRAMLAGALAFSYSVVLELAQFGIPQRSVSGIDILFNLAGSGAGAGIYWLTRRVR
jgi:VanZ family protein